MKKLTISVIATALLLTSFSFSTAGNLPPEIKEDLKCTIAFDEKALEGTILEIDGEWIKFRDTNAKGFVYLKIDQINYIRIRR